MTDKAHRAAAFLSWLFQTSFPEVKFDLTLHASTRCYFFSISMSLLVFYLFFFNIKKKKKKNGGEDAEFLYFLLMAFQICMYFYLIAHFIVL
jgi:hypothetical protein